MASGWNSAEMKMAVTATPRAETTIWQRTPMEPSHGNHSVAPVAAAWQVVINLTAPACCSSSGMKTAMKWFLAMIPSADLFRWRMLPEEALPLPMGQTIKYHLLPIRPVVFFHMPTMVLMTWSPIQIRPVTPQFTAMMPIIIWPGLPIQMAMPSMPWYLTTKTDWRVMPNTVRPGQYLMTNVLAYIKPMSRTSTTIPGPINTTKPARFYTNGTHWETKPPTHGMRISIGPASKIPMEIQWVLHMMPMVTGFPRLMSWEIPQPIPMMKRFKKCHP